MTIQHAYERAGDLPSRIMLEVTLANAFNGRTFPHKAKVDTGADGTEIPDSLRRRLDLQPHGEVIVTYGDQRKKRKRIYLANISFDTFTCEDIEVTAEFRSNILLGRDVLNQFKMNCDGINEVFTFER